jgi:hypothetical protein
VKKIQKLRADIEIYFHHNFFSFLTQSEKWTKVSNPGFPHLLSFQILPASEVSIAIDISVKGIH